MFQKVRQALVRVFSIRRRSAIFSRAHVGPHHRRAAAGRSCPAAVGRCAASRHARAAAWGDAWSGYAWGYGGCYAGCAGAHQQAELEPGTDPGHGSNLERIGGI